MICKNCQFQNATTAKFCTSCGNRLLQPPPLSTNSQAQSRRGQRTPPPLRSNSNTASRPQSGSSSPPVVSTILSLLIVGLGQLYNKDFKKGILMLVGGIILGTLSSGILWFGIAIWSAIDAWQVASGQKPIWS